MSTDTLKKIAMVAGMVTAVLGPVKALVPPQYAELVSGIGAVAAALAALYHPAPGAAPQA